MSVFIHPFAHRKNARKRGGGWREGREGGKERGRGYKGQYAGKHLHGIETMSRFQVARGQFFRGWFSNIMVQLMSNPSTLSLS